MGASKITDENITRERTVFLIALPTAIAISWIILCATAPNSPKGSDLLWLLGFIAFWATLPSQGTAVYLIYRLSRFLRHPVWLTVTYCILSLLPLLFWVPIIGLLADTSKEGRKTMSGAIYNATIATSHTNVNSSERITMTEEDIAKESDFFFGRLFLLFVIGLLAWYLVQTVTPDTARVIVIGWVVPIPVFFVYLIYRLSRFLRHPVWLTVTYCILSLLPLLFWVPIIFLLVHIKKAKRKITLAT